MKSIPVNTSVDITVEDLAQSITPEEIGDLFCELCNYMHPGSSDNERRRIIGQIADGLHENATRMLGEVVALAYHKVRNELETVVPMPKSPTPFEPEDNSDVPF